MITEKCFNVFINLVITMLLIFIKIENFFNLKH